VPKPKAIFFDLGNVVIRLRTAHFLERMTGVCDARWTQAAILEAIREPAGPHIDYEKGLIPGEEFHRHLQGRFGLRLDYRGWLDVWNDYFEPNRPMEALITRLRGQARFFALSNTNAEHWGHVKMNFRVLDGFEGIVASHLVGARKPEAAIFEAALRMAGVAAEEALYLDDMKPFIETAKGLGWQGFHYAYNDDELRRDLLAMGFELPSLEGRAPGMFC
jgi:HAD superfamily hydrolase (TIGR01509 family)